MRVQTLIEGLDPNWTNPRGWTPFQRAVMIALRKHNISPWALAGHWWYGKPLKGIGRIPAPEKPPYVDKLYHISQNHSLPYRVHTMAAFYVSCLLWERLFPKTKGHYDGPTLFRQYGLDQVNDIESWMDNYSKNTAENLLYPWAFDFGSKDEVRLSTADHTDDETFWKIAGWSPKKTVAEGDGLDPPYLRKQSKKRLPKGFSEIRGEEGTGIYRFAVPGVGSGDLWTDWNGNATIYGFQSEESGKGLGRRTLQWLRQFFQDITVMDPGHQGSDSYMFWTKMADEGLVQRLTDEEGLVEYP